MAEYIEREATYADLEKCNGENPKWTPSRVKALIARQKAADVAPVVRCRECKHRDEFTKMCQHPKAIGWDAIDPEDDDFCSYGERRADT